MGPKVSVIVSLYRGERYLEKFLENIAEQTWFEEIEFVVDHNEPTEMEIRMLDEFERAHPGRLKRMVREKVVPYSASWNRCIREASSDIVGEDRADLVNAIFPLLEADGFRPVLHVQ
jgi:glycosyltransferase involved in cell wall biosynthesis